MTELDEVIEAGKKATPRPWFADDDSMKLHADRGVGGEICDVCECPEPDKDGNDNKRYLALAANHADKYAARLKRIGEIAGPQLRRAVSVAEFVGADRTRVSYDLTLSEARELLSLLKDR